MQTFTQFQASRSELRKDLASDLDAKRQHDLQQRQLSLQDLILQLSTEQLTSTAEERDFLTQKEALVTSLHRIEAEAEVQYAQSQLAHMNQKAAIETEHNRQLQQLTAALPNLMSKSAALERDSDFSASSSSSKPRRARHSTKTLDDLEDSEETDLMYSLRITALDAQKRELAQAIRDEKQGSESRILELTIMLEDEENDRQAELETLRHKMEKQEETAKKTMKRLYTDLDAIQQKRQRLMQGHKGKIEDLERRIEAVGGDFNQKLGQATRTAEMLKTRLVNANMRKNQHLEAERKRSSKQQRLLQETYSLHQEVFDMQKRVNNAREESGVLRRELSVSLGPRRTASMFM
jgi:hypothetical protein